MGISIDAMFLVGVDYSKMYEIYEEKDPEGELDIRDWLEQEWSDNSLVSASPYYDSDLENQFFGFMITDGVVSEFKEEFDREAKRFFDVYGVEPEVIISPNVV